VDKLTALTASEFDDAYLAAMIKGHKKDAKAFKAEATATQDADVKSFLDNPFQLSKHICSTSRHEKIAGGDSIAHSSRDGSNPAPIQRR
jgi:predicted outer membrane protein